MSASIIDSLVVMLGLDDKDLNSKAPAAVNKFGQVESASQKVTKAQAANTAEIKKSKQPIKEQAQGLDEVAKSLGTFLAALGGTALLKQFVQDTIIGSAAMGRFSQNTGEGVGVVASWGNAAEQMGGSADDLQSSMMMLSKAQTQLQLTGESSLIPYFSKLGVALTQNGLQARSSESIFLDLADSLSHYDRRTGFNILSSMGIGPGTANLILAGRVEVEKMIARQREYAQLQERFAPTAIKVQSAVIGLKQQFMTLGLAILQDAMPYLEKFVALLERFAEWCAQHKTFVEGFLSMLAAGLAAIAIAALPLDLTAGLVLALGAALALLYDDYQTWKNGGDSLIDWGRWKPGIDAAKFGIQELGDVIKVSIGSMFKDIQGIVDLLNGDWKKAFDDFNQADVMRAQGAAKAVKNTYDFIAGNSDAGKEFHSDSGIAMNDWAGGGSSTSPSAMMEFFQKNGMTRDHAAGIVANLMGESNGKASAVGDNGTAYGLGQWHKDRQDDFRKWSGKDIRDSSANEQLAFVLHELQTTNKGAGDALNNAQGAFASGDVISRMYERPADVVRNANARGAAAQNLAGSDHSVSTQIDTINIHTQATDATGIARDLDKSLDYLTYASQANYGMVP